MQSGVIRGHIRNEIQHSTLSNHRPERILARPARFLSFVSHRFHRFAQILSLQATVLYTSSLTVKKICVICGKIKHSTLIINKNEKGNNSESNQFRHHRPHCRPQLLLCAELQVIAFEHELHESNESICSMAIFVSFLPTLALQPRRNLWKTSSTVSPSTIPMSRF